MTNSDYGIWMCTLYTLLLLSNIKLVPANLDILAMREIELKPL